MCACPYVCAGLGVWRLRAVTACGGAASHWSSSRGSWPAWRRPSATSETSSPRTRGSSCGSRCAAGARRSLPCASVYVFVCVLQRKFDQQQAGHLDLIVNFESNLNKLRHIELSAPLREAMDKAAATATAAEDSAGPTAAACKPDLPALEVSAPLHPLNSYTLYVLCWPDTPYTTASRPRESRPTCSC